MKTTTEGCARCRLDLIRFVRDTKLPKFSMAAGEEWHLPQSRYLEDGSAELGGGTIPRDSFEVVKADEHRACNCPCQK